MRKARTLSGKKLEISEPHPQGPEMAMALLTKRVGSMYVGTVLKNQIDKRRAKSRVAKHSRKVNRGGK